MTARETVRPAGAAEAAAALADAARSGRSVRVRGGGTKAYLGDAHPADLTLETGALTGIVDHVPADLTVTVRAGSRLADVQAALRVHGQFLPLDPPHADGATCGGIVAADSNGFGRLRYGGVRDLLIGTVTALVDGTVARAGGRVVKNVAGYDLNKLLIGSLGTLGVITETTFKVLPVPAAASCAVARSARPADAFAIADALVRTPLRPAALVVEGTRRSWATIVAARGDRSIVERAMADTVAAADRVRAVTDRTEDVEAVLAPLRDLPASATDGVLVRASLPLAAQRPFAEAAAQLEPFARCVADGCGVVRVHLRGDDAAVVLAADTLLAAARALGGSARFERRAAALARELGAWGPPPGGEFLMRRIKAAFDPAGVLEPGRSIVG